MEISIQYIFSISLYSIDVEFKPTFTKGKKYFVALQFFFKTLLYSIQVS